MGQTLTADITPVGATCSYQWKAADTADGEYMDIEGATGKTRKLAADVQGKFVKVQATGTGEFSGVILSAATTAVAAE